MKILFKNTTKYDKENKEKFINFHTKKYGKKELTKEIIIALAILYIVMFNIVHFNWKFLIMLIPISIVIYYINNYLMDKNKEQDKKQKNKEFTFFFYEKYVKVKIKRKFERLNYFEFKKIFETKENFFLYTDDKHSLILDKEGFSIGNSQGFSDFIRRKCPFKYRNQEEK